MSLAEIPMPATPVLTGPQYLKEGLRLVLSPGLRLFVLLPLAINLILFVGLIYVAVQQFGGWVDTPVYWRDHLPLDPQITGPAIIEQMDTTIVVEPGDVVTSDSDGNLILHIGGRDA